MIELKSNNLFIRNESSSIYGIEKILKFYDDCGKNILGIELNGCTNTIKSDYPGNWDDIFDRIRDNLYNIDIIAISTTNRFGKKMDLGTCLSKIRNITDIPLIIVAQNDRDRENYFKFETIYSFYVEPNADLHKLDYIIESQREGWTSDIKSLKIQYLRDKNISDILGDVE